LEHPNRRTQLEIAASTDGGKEMPASSRQVLSCHKKHNMARNLIAESHVSRYFNGIVVALLKTYDKKTSVGRGVERAGRRLEQAGA
jgi:hypothetical protein